MKRGIFSALAAIACAACSSNSGSFAGDTSHVGETAITDSCTNCPEMVSVTGGSFQMGETIDYGYGPMDGPRHTVIVRPFAIAVHEVTRAQFARFVADSGYDPKPACNVYTEGNLEWHIDVTRTWSNPGFDQAEDHPVVCISWDDAQAYIGWLNSKSDGNYRLPAEAEWEYLASMGGLGVLDHNSANMGSDPCCGGRVLGADVWFYTAPVGSFSPDKFGLHDVRGNVWEWQADCFHPDYEDAPVDGRARTNDCMYPDQRAIRGGSYGDADFNYKPTFRLRGPRDQGYFTLGFRVAADLP
jgi:formylglycine-generating enzyme required for sulfatase activity